jgi:hypothetical protein
MSTYFTVAAIADSLVRTAAEASLIRGFAPAGNSNVPRVAELSVNFPSQMLLGVDF